MQHKCCNLCNVKFLYTLNYLTISVRLYEIKYGYTYKGLSEDEVFFVMSKPVNEMQYLIMKYYSRTISEMSKNIFSCNQVKKEKLFDIKILLIAIT